MEKEKIKSDLIYTINNYLEKVKYPSRVSPETSLGELSSQLDSLDTLAVIIEIESKFGVDLPQKDFTNHTELSSIADYIYKNQSSLTADKN